MFLQTTDTITPVQFIRTYGHLYNKCGITCKIHVYDLTFLLEDKLRVFTTTGNKTRSFKPKRELFLRLKMFFVPKPNQYISTACLKHKFD